MVGLPDLGNDNIGCPVKSGFQIHDEQGFSLSTRMSEIYKYFIHTLRGTYLPYTIVYCLSETHI